MPLTCSTTKTRAAPDCRENASSEVLASPAGIAKARGSCDSRAAEAEEAAFGGVAARASGVLPATRTVRRQE
jgi:hypothetical protein